MTMEELFIEIYTKKKIKYCACCLHTEDVAKLFSMQNYGWVFISLFTNLYLTDELQHSWICSWCIQRLNNAKKLLENFQHAQIILSKMVEDTSFKTEEITNDICNEINEHKTKSRLNCDSIINNVETNRTIHIECETGVKNELSDSDDNSYDGEYDSDYEDELDPRNDTTTNKPSGEEKAIEDYFHYNLRRNRWKQKTVSTESSRKCNKTREGEKTKICEEIKSEERTIHILQDKLNAVSFKNDIKIDINNFKDKIDPDKLVTSELNNEPSQILSLGSDEDDIPLAIRKKTKPEILKNFESNMRFKKGKKIKTYLPHVPRIQCTECDLLFVRESALLNHIKRKHKKKIPCEYCDKMFSKEVKLRTHVVKMHEAKTGTFECDVCGRNFKDRLKIVQHMMKHEKYGKSLKEIEITVCDHCGKICNRRNIKSHLMKHSTVKKHRCPFCSASFKTSWALENHIMRRHKDPSLEKIFACEQCGRKFYDPTQVKYHMISIHSYQGHACPICSKCFPTRGKCAEHVRRVHDKIPHVRDKQCDFCEKLFSTNRSLKYHRYTHTGEKPFKCDLCTSAYNQKHCLIMHKERAHNIEKLGSNIVKHCS